MAEGSGRTFASKRLQTIPLIQNHTQIQQNNHQQPPPQQSHLQRFYHIVPHCALVDHNAPKFHTRASLEVENRQNIKKLNDAAQLKIKFKAKVSSKIENHNRK